MLIHTSKAQLKALLADLRRNGKTLGFVPTMGALHQGHISLIEKSAKKADFTICSIFVNPTQFNDKKDLENYPRTPEKDIEMLKNSPCDLLFMPAVDEIYEKERTDHFDFGYLDKILEGAHRPGHFNGVAQVVKRFFEIIEPDWAFFGSKDYQQVMIVKSLVKQMHLKTEIVPCTIVREPDGLAMSSRNVLLSEGDRKLAGKIPALMSRAAEIARKHSVGAAKLFVNNEVKELAGTKLEYYEIANADTLESISHLENMQPSISLIAMYVGKVRLIDNLPVN
jgi:pantoate--beta-alanine ligase